MSLNIMQSNTSNINNSFVNKDILSLDQFDQKSIQTLFKTAETIAAQMKKGKIFDLLTGKVINLLFFEPSTRTFGSFVSAVKRLGGQTIEYQDPAETSSYVKGETLEDTTRVFECYSDMIIIRHPEAGAAKRVADVVQVPVINGGDGPAEHPTQALYDMFTIYQKFGHLDNLVGVIGGDLLYGRTAHSLIKGLSIYKNNTFYLLAPKPLQLSDGMIRSFTKRGVKLIPIENTEEIPTNAHFWYWTRVQKERFINGEDYEEIKNQFIITPKLAKEKGNKDMIIMHPLPRVGEIDPRLDSDPRAVYLPIQIKNGLYIRMALLALIFGKM